MEIVQGGLHQFFSALMISFERFLQFLKSSQALSPGIALETVAVLQDGGREVDITKADLYSRFSITGKEISAFVVHRDFEWSKIASLSSVSLVSAEASKETGGVILPVLDPCGMTLVLDQICVQHPDHPSRRLAKKVPCLDIHSSLARYHALLSFLSAIGDGDNKLDDSLEIGVAVPWQCLDYSWDARIWHQYTKGWRDPQ